MVIDHQLKEPLIMSEEQNRKRWEHMSSQPFVPPGISGTAIASDLRIAAALEYIASQLGQINAKLDVLTKEQPRRMIRDSRP